MSFLSLRGTTLLSLAGLIFLLGFGFVFLKDGKTKELEKLFAKAPKVMSEVAVGVGDALNTQSKSMSSNLGSSLLGATSSDVFMQFVEKGIGGALGGNGKLIPISPWSGRIFETLTPFPELLTVSEYRYVLDSGEMTFYVISKKDQAITNVYSFLLQLVNGPNKNNKVVIQEFKDAKNPSFYYIHLDKPQNVRIVSFVTNDIAVAVDAPTASQNALQSFLTTLRTYP